MRRWRCGASRLDREPRPGLRSIQRCPCRRTVDGATSRIRPRPQGASNERNAVDAGRDPAAGRHRRGRRECGGFDQRLGDSRWPGSGAEKSRRHDRPVRVRQRKGCRRPAAVAAQGDQQRRRLARESAGRARAAPAPADKVEIDQNGCVFVPRVVVVPAGGTVDFLNSDRLLHNIHATPKLNVSFNRTQPKDRTIPVTFAKPEIVRINCDLHSWMIGLGGRRGASVTTRSPAPTGSSASTICRRASTSCRSGTNASAPSRRA